MTNQATDPRRIAVWRAMADHFLDTETRHEIPMTAFYCVQAGLTREQASEVWRYEVSPAVAFNLRDVAGEWAGWDAEWLVERIERLRSRWHHRPGTLRALRYRLRTSCLHGVWVSIERCMESLSALDCPVERRRRAEDLAFLARHYFDFGPDALAARPSADRQRIRSLYPEPFQRTLGPALVPGEEAAADARARSALDQGRP